MALRRILQSASVVLLGSVWSATALTFTSPTASTIFSSTALNTVSFERTASDPAFVDLYLFSSDPSNPLGPTHFKLIASSISTSAPLQFSAGGPSILPPGSAYMVVATARGAAPEGVAFALSPAFTIVAGNPPAVVTSSPPTTSSSASSVTSASLSASASSSTDVSSSSTVSTPSVSSSMITTTSPKAAAASDKGSPSIDIQPAVAPGGSEQQGVALGSGASSLGSTGWKAGVGLGAAGMGLVWLL